MRRKAVHLETPSYNNQEEFYMKTLNVKSKWVYLSYNTSLQHFFKQCFHTPFCTSLWSPYKTRQHSSRMRITRLSSIRVSVAIIRCQYWWGRRRGPQVNKFDDQQWWPTDVSGEGGRSHVWSPGGSEPCTVRSNASSVMVTWDPPFLWRQTPVKTLPSRNFVCGR